MGTGPGGRDVSGTKGRELDHGQKKLQCSGCHTNLGSQIGLVQPHNWG